MADEKPTLRSVVQEFLRWHRIVNRPGGNDYLNGELTSAGRIRPETCYLQDGHQFDRDGNFVEDRDGWDDLDDICKRARKALRR
jgi:hypothetical protein